MSEKIIKYGDFISTDDIIPAKYRYLALDIPKLSEHAFEDRRRELWMRFFQRIRTSGAQAKRDRLRPGQIIRTDLLQKRYQYRADSLGM